MATRNYILATAGHVDHGKSALVKALTGSDPDRLPEEKARGITIDLGFAHLRLPLEGRRTAAADLNVGIVDVPGHEDFVKNMVAGIGAIDAALFVVAADDGWMPQSEEHLQILEYAGVRHGVVALTKIDRLDPSARAEVIASIQSALGGTALAGLPIVPTSVVTGEGLDTLRRELADGLARSPGPRDVGKPRLWVDRAFSLRGIGTVVTGSLRGGEFEAGQVVAIAGRDSAAKIRTIHQHNAAQPKAAPGTRTALNLVGVAAGAGEHAAVVARGDLVTLSDRGAAFETCDVLLSRSTRTGRLRGSERALDHGATVRLHVGTASVRCRVIFADRAALRPGENALAQLRLEAPLPVSDGDHVVLRDSGECVTLAGGVILATGTPRSRFRGAAHQQFLAAQAKQPHDCGAWLQASLRRDGFAASHDLRLPSRFGDAEITAVLDRLAAAGVIVRGEGWVGLKDRWQALKQTAELRIAAHEREHPAQNGLPLVQLRSALGVRLSPVVFQALVAELSGAGCETVGAAIRHQSFRPSLPQALQLAADEVMATLRRTRLNPPSRKDLGRTAAVEFLLKTGRVVALTPDIAIAANVYHAAARSACEYLAAHGRATVSELKQALGTSRRVMVPLLERMDRDGVTQRDGEHRVLRKAPAAIAG